jgi:photosystem II stability/assembly factor-like uncharacterized protein
MSRSSAWSCALLCACVGVAAHDATAQQRPSPEISQAKLNIDTTIYQKLRYRYVGPEGNRITSIAGVPGDPDVYYAGAASGGIFKSTDGGVHWTSIFDDQPVSSVGAIAVAPSDANVVYAGTGEAFIRSHVSTGWGVFKSTDAGRSWSRAGLENTGRIARVVVHPTNPDVVFVAAMGHSYGPQQERGVYRSTDGGAHWDRVLFTSDSAGASDVVMDPTNPRILYAGMWQLEIHTWGRSSGGPGSGIWKSTDGGTTWKNLTHNPGLPKGNVGKVGLAVSKAMPNRIYATVETGDVPDANGKGAEPGRLFRSDDAGATWQLMNSDREVTGRTHYYNRMGVEPDNADQVYFLQAAFAKTVDGGRTVTTVPFTQSPGGDHHDIWIDPTNGDRMIVSHDGGVSVSTNRGRTWIQTQPPVAQMYHVEIDNKVPYNLYGNRQDGPSVMIPSNTRTGDFGGFLPPDFPTIARGAAVTVGGGESGWAWPDTVDGNTVWSSASGFGNGGCIVTTYDRRTQLIHYVEIWPQYTTGWAPDSLRHRCVWDAPVLVSQFDHNKVYVGSQYVNVTTDRGNTWRQISPDLTRNEKSHQQLSGGLTPDNIGVEYGDVIYRIAESPLDQKVLWTGSNDGLLQVTRDAGATWQNMTAGLAGIPTYATISSIEPSRYDANTVFVTVDGHQVNSRDPWVYRTTDGGRTWRLITNGLAKTPLSYMHVIREDPVRRGLLYLGGENAMYVSFDNGDNWQTFQTNLPHAPVYWIVVQPQFNDLVIATYGRGFWIMDDITPLRQLDAATFSKPAALFAPRASYRLHDAEQTFAVSYDPSAGFNPPSGAPINYWMKASSDSTVRDSAGTKLVSKDSVTLTISDASGAVVRTLHGPVNAGINRVWWNFRADATKEARIRTSPESAPWLTVPLEGRRAPGVGRIGVLLPPGTYTVKLTTPQGYTESKQLTVLKDPNDMAPAAEMAENVALAQQLSRDMDATVAMINALENVRGQLAAMKATVASDSTRKDIATNADSLDLKLRLVERRLFQTRVTGHGQDDVRWPARVAEQLQYLADQLQASDYAPTASQKQVAQLLHDQMQQAKAEFDKVMNTDVAGFNTMLQQKKVGNVIISDY